MGDAREVFCILHDLWHVYHTGDICTAITYKDSNARRFSSYVAFLGINLLFNHCSALFIKELGGQ